MRGFDFKEGAFYDFYPQVEIKFCNYLRAHLNQIISGLEVQIYQALKKSTYCQSLNFSPIKKKTVVFLTALFLEHERFLHLDLHLIFIGLEFMAILK